MNGPQHYAEAERLLKSTTRYYNGGQTVREEPPSEAAVARAQVHATLALAAASVAGRGLGPQESWGGQHFEILSPANEAWERVTR